tara:strand:- start:488 stop:1510 length:1023 start_codon:yes stop_codon:yes gene_type:complete
MSWTISRSWESPTIISTLAAVGNNLLVSAGLEIMLLDDEAQIKWQRSMPFRVHGAEHGSGQIALLCGHGFHLVRASDGRQLGEGRSTNGGFSDVMARPGGGWVLSCRKGQLHVFNQEGRGIKRLDSGKVRRLVGWFDREHLMWQDDKGRLRCARLAKDDSQRLIEDRVWSWASRMAGGKVLLQSADGILWEGVPHPYGWDGLEAIDKRSLEPLAAFRAGDGWWVLSIEGSIHSMSSEEELGLSDLGEMLCGVATDTMVTATRNGLVRFWQSPDLANLRRAEMQRMVADAQIASDWDERKRIFQRDCQAEEEGRISLAVELYDSLGRSNDVNRLLKRQRGD